MENPLFHRQMWKSKELGWGGLDSQPSPFPGYSRHDFRPGLPELLDDVLGLDLESVHVAVHRAAL